MMHENQCPDWKQKIFTEMFGRRLLQGETDCTEEELQRAVEAGVLMQLPGIEIRRGRYQCNGCGNTNQDLFAAHACYRCHHAVCYYCRNCIQVRKISACTPLYIWNPQCETPSLNPLSLPLTNTKDALVWSGQLTLYQAKASKAIIQKIHEEKDILIHAVTGAGKTEMMFQPIAYALEKGKQVCFASPRTDVVLELAPRLKHVFPQIDTAVYYGGSEEKKPHASLILSTTHQLMRFHQRFDVLILDESDAFPYKGDSTLKFSLLSALKPRHKLIYCTATPEPKLLKELKKNQTEVMFVPQRFHGRPLEIPKWIWIGKWKENLRRAKVSRKFIKKLQERLRLKRQVFVFVPYVEVAKQLSIVLENMQIQADYVYAEDPMRRKKVEAFRNHMLDVLVSTTILERGVTVPFTDVFVFGSEARIFDAAALVQICGRAGRHKDDTYAKIYFFHEGITKAMRKAMRQIVEMNRRSNKID